MLFGDIVPGLEYSPAKSIDFLSISCCNKNTGTKQVLKCSTPMLGSLGIRVHGPQGLGFALAC